MNVKVIRSATDGEGVVKRDGEWLLDHDGDTVLRSYLDGMAVFSDGSVDENGLGVSHLNHIGHAAEEKGFRQRVFLLIFGEERRIGIGDAYQLDISVTGQGAKKAVHVAVFESDDGDS
jgi:hypothetical protein